MDISFYSSFYKTSTHNIEAQLSGHMATYNKLNGSYHIIAKYL